MRPAIGPIRRPYQSLTRYWQEQGEEGTCLPALSLGCTFPTAVHLQWKEAARWLAPPHRCGSLAVLSPAHPQEAAPFGVGLLVMSSPDRLTGGQID